MTGIIILSTIRYAVVLTARVWGMFKHGLGIYYWDREHRKRMRKAEKHRNLRPPIRGSGEY